MSRRVFFRQGGWMMMATVFSGACMFLVHPFSKKIPEAEYGVFGTLLSLIGFLGIPGLGLQMLFAQQTAAALDAEKQRRLTGAVRTVTLASLGLWLGMATIVFVRQDAILSYYHIVNPVALWAAMALVLVSLWSPIFGGVLQGTQNFLWMGMAGIQSGLTRLGSVAIIVLVLHGEAAGMMIGACLGAGAALLIYVWQTRSVWMSSGAPFEWRPWLRRVIPLTAGLAAFQFMLGADLLFVQGHFPKDQTGSYTAVGTLSRALVMFTAPLALVMFPKLVRSLARGEKSDTLMLTLGTTAALAVIGAIGVSVVAPVVLKVFFNKSFASAAPLLPWFAAGMVPLALAQVLINNLLAHERFEAVPWLAAIAVAYALTLYWWRESFTQVVQVLGVYNLLLCLVAGWFTRRERRRACHVK